ncbi:MAG: hypothetical protein Q9227_006170 [Pyrenula ochraceoflavens]
MAKLDPDLYTALNRDALKSLEEILKETPATDLRPHLRDQMRIYREECNKELEKLKPPEPQAPDPDTAARWKRFLPMHGNLSIRYPLSPRLATLLQEPSVDLHNGHSSHPQHLTSRTTLFELIDKGEWIHELWSKAVVKISPDIVVKICRTDGTIDLMNLQHVRAHSSITQIPVPEPLGILKDDRRFYTFMSYVHGISLEGVWDRLAPDRKEHVRQQLNAIFHNLRNLPLPSNDGYLGSGDPLRCLDKRRFDRQSSFIVKNEHEFNDFLFSEHYDYPQRVALLRSTFGTNHCIVMTHGDLHPRNILVDNEDDLNITGIVDWDTGGGYPEYWEYIKALSTAFQAECPDWAQYLPVDGIGNYAEDYVKDQMLDRMVN